MNRILIYFLFCCVSISGFSQARLGVIASSLQIASGGCTGGTTSFAGNWTTSPTLGGWATSNYNAGRIFGSGTTWHGLASASAEVRPTDLIACTVGDCNRSEVAELPKAGGGLIQDEQSIGSKVYFATSYKIPGAWSSHNANWELVWQLHGPSSYGTNPVFQLELGTTGGYIIYWKSGDINSPFNHTYTPSITTINYDGWTDFVLAITFQKTTTGTLEMWRRDQGNTSFTKVLNVTGISTLQYDGANPVDYHYWKQGLYRGYESSRIDNMFFGPMARGTTFCAVEQAAFNTNVGEP